MTFVFKNIFSPLANDEPDDQSEVSDTSIPSIKPPADCPDALFVYREKKKKKSKRKKNRNKSSATLNPRTIHHANKADGSETANSAGPSVKTNYLLNDAR